MKEKMEKTKRLFEQFPPVSAAEWMDKITADLKGADFRKKLIWKTPEGLEVMPFYRQEDLKDGEFPFLKMKKNGNNSWKVRQDIRVTDYRASNSEALDVLMKGVDSIGFLIEDPETINPGNFSQLLKGIAPGAVEINFFTNGKAIETINIFDQWLKELCISPSDVYGAVEADPLGRLLMNGTLCIPHEKGFDYLAELYKAAMQLPNFRIIDIKASFLANAGSDLAMELAMAVSMGVEYIDQLTSRGINAGNAAPKIRFTFGTGSQYFAEIAKLRAARLLWATVMNGFTPAYKTASEMEIHSVTTRWNKTIYDPYVNMLRTQTEAMSAVIGGADSITVEPFDTAFRIPDSFSKRIARNQQLILKEESYLDRVADPSGGSYYIERLTRMIADKAWKLFIEIEEKGGFLEALKTGVIQKVIKESADTKRSEISKRRTALLGTNIFPDLGEKMPEGTNLNIAFPDFVKGKDLLCEPVNVFRSAEIFEKLRIDVERASRKPSVFLFTVGDKVMSKARARFSADFFGCAGYKIINNQGFKSVEEGVQSAMRTEADLVVICSSDEEYGILAPDIFRMLKDRFIVVVAGNPSCTEDLKAAGIEHFISIRSDAGTALGHFNKLLGIS